jgi:CRISPR-associated endonuclease/helicase Cas3
MSSSQPINALIAKRARETGNQQTLAGHIGDCLTVLKRIFDADAASINSFCEKWCYSPAALRRSIFLTVYLHDIGKATREFQTNISKGRYSQKYPHAFFGMPIVLNLLRGSLKEYVLERDLGLEVCSILAHHTQLYNNMYDDVTSNVNFLFKEAAQFVNSIQDVYEADFKKYFDFHFAGIFENELKAGKAFEDEFSTADYIRNFRSAMVTYYSVNISTSAEKEKVKASYSFCHSFLKACDQIASKHFEEVGSKQFPTRIPFGRTLQDASQFFDRMPINRNRLSSNLTRQFQNSISTNPYRFQLLWAPCGRGKTRAALGWAATALEKFNRDRIIFAMPTQITSNSLREDLIKEIQADQRKAVGLFHGKSFLALKRELSNERKKNEADELLLAELKDTTYNGKIFHEPITVSTIDHLVYSFVHGYRQADYALGNILRSVIVFDEAHYYEEQSLQCMMSLFKILRKMHIPHIIMSGTLPKFFISRVNEGEEYNFIVDEEGMDFTPFVIRRRKREFLVGQNNLANESVIDEIKNNYEHYRLNQFIILNTVSKAQVFYEALKNKISRNENIMLLHSQFTYSHRLVKEQSINKRVENGPVILVATQVIEISLNISCDQMYTELAPPDALGQRGGRLNRGGEKPYSGNKQFIMHVFDVEKPNPYQEDIILKTDSHLPNGEYSYRRIKQICDDVYQQRNLLYNIGFDSLFKESVLFGRPYWDIANGDDEGNPGFQFRDAEPRVSTIPWSEYRGQTENLKAENEVQIPLWKLLRYRDDETMFTLIDKNEHEKYWICMLKYDNDVGFHDERDEDSLGSNTI